MTYEYDSHKSKKREKETCTVLDFIGRMTQQILPKRFQRARFYGLQATKSYEKSKIKIKEGIDKVKDVEDQEEVFVAAKVKGTYAERMKIWTGKNPLKCPACGHLMEIIKIWSSKLGTIYDLLAIYQKSARAPPKELLSLKKIVPTEPKDIPKINLKILEQMNLCF